MIYERDVARHPEKKSGLPWIDASDLSPFCGVRSDEILSVFRTYLHEVEVRTAATLTVPMARTRSLDLADVIGNLPRWRIHWALLKRRSSPASRLPSTGSGAPDETRRVASPATPGFCVHERMGRCLHR
jgi:hypothetical protein